MRLGRSWAKCAKRYSILTAVDSFTPEQDARLVELVTEAQSLLPSGEVGYEGENWREIEQKMPEGTVPHTCYWRWERLSHAANGKHDEAGVPNGEQLGFTRPSLPRSPFDSA
jgi:hypothetical protein